MKTVEEITKYREMKVEQLQALILEMKRELALNTLKIKAGKLSNSAVISKTRKNLARALTILSQKEME